MPATTTAPAQVAPVRSPWLTVLIAWLLPGAGHFFLGRRIRAALVFATVIIAFLVGVGMQGPFFETSGAADVLSRLIQWGGFIGDLACGLLYFIAVWAGYAPPDRAGHTADYGAKFIVAAGLLNILAMVDAYEIATHVKE